MQNRFESWLRQQTLSRFTTYVLLDNNFMAVACDPPLCNWEGEKATSPINRYFLTLFPELLGLEERLMRLFSNSQDTVELSKIWRLGPGGEDRFYDLRIEPAAELGDYLMVTVADKTPQTQIARQLQQVRDEIGSLEERLAQSYDEMDYLQQRLKLQSDGETFLFSDDAADFGNERRTITLLAADTSCFMSSMSRISPRVALEKLGDHLQRVTDVVEMHHGTILYRTGDFLMAAFNAVEDQPEHVVMAARAALALRAAVTDLFVSEGLHTRCRRQFGIGINTGLVLTGYVSTPRGFEFQAVGETINIATRLCHQAADGQILLGSESCRRLYGRAFTKTYGGVLLKNSLTTAAYELSSLAGERMQS